MHRGPRDVRDGRGSLAVGVVRATRACYRLAYASQQESAHQRGLGRSQKIRMRLGGSPNMLEEFPHKPKGMHWRTYERQRRLHDTAEERSIIGLMGFVERAGPTIIPAARETKPRQTMTNCRRVGAQALNVPRAILLPHLAARPADPPTIKQSAADDHMSR